VSSTALVLGPSDEDRYGWPGAEAGPRAGALDGTCTAIARHVIRAQAHSVGFLPAAGALVKGASAAPLLSRIAAALVKFLPDDRSVALVDTWPTWGWGPAMEAGDTSLFRTRALQPRVLELSPVPCGDAEAAVATLQASLEARPPGLGVVLVNLAGYVAPGAMPAAVDFVEGVVLLAGRRRTWGGGLVRMSRFLPVNKNLGTILVD
jgi:hypothetical protein